MTKVLSGSVEPVYMVVPGDNKPLYQCDAGRQVRKRLLDTRQAQSKSLLPDRGCPWEDRAQIMGLLGKLSEAHAQVLVLRHMDNLSRGDGHGDRLESKKRLVKC